MSEKKKKKIKVDSEESLVVKPNNGVRKRKLAKEIKLNALNENQAKFLDLLNDPDKKIIFAIGPAGTGKTFMAMCHALKSLETYDKIVYARPNVPTRGESELGALPGMAADKLSWLRIPIYDLLESRFNEKNIDSLFDDDLIEVTNIGFLRGRSLRNKIIVSDEAQNMSYHLLKTLITRLGENSKMIILGDPKQIDIKNEKENSFEMTARKLSVLPEVGVVNFTRNDIVRTGIMKRILDILEPAE
jgi:phosphate starvation-inducible PhoH-like protein